ncbi:MAG: sulfatase-like hydrolase/transferase [Gammaproteobacteria bacterium]|nr:sulfatase-like hydrolase/transferase [Gammaproteobacteria bacterium]
MLKKLFYFLPIFLISVFLIWEYKVNILLWSIPKIASITSPVQENIPTSWSKGPEVASEDDRPNIILILADDMGYNDISMHNGGAADGTLQTQNIDALAKSGMLFTRGYAANATCAPSRASIMTGKYPTRFGYEFTPIPSAGRLILQWLAEEDDAELRQRIDREVATKIPPFMQQGMPTEEITIAEVLRDAGYYTAHIGKWHLGHAYGMDPFSQGFQDSLSLVGPLYLPEDHPDVVNAKFDTTIDQMIWGIGQYSATFNEGELFAPDKYLTDYYTDEALKVIENNKNRPFFLYLSHWAIHNPLQALRSDVEQMSHMEGHNLQVYSGMIAALDRSVGKVVQKLKELDIHGKTLIIFTSDNGGANYIELDDINKPYRGWKISFFEGGIRVPYIVSWPDKINPEQTSNSAVHHFDIFSTIASAAGIQSSYEDELDGVNL